MESWSFGRSSSAILKVLAKFPLKCKHHRPEGQLIFKSFSITGDNCVLSSWLLIIMKPGLTSLNFCHQHPTWNRELAKNIDEASAKENSLGGRKGTQETPPLLRRNDPLAMMFFSRSGSVIWC